MARDCSSPVDSLSFWHMLISFSSTMGISEYFTLCQLNFGFFGWSLLFGMVWLSNNEHVPKSWMLYLPSNVAIYFLSCPWLMFSDKYINFVGVSCKIKKDFTILYAEQEQSLFSISNLPGNSLKQTLQT